MGLFDSKKYKARIAELEAELGYAGREKRIAELDAVIFAKNKVLTDINTEIEKKNIESKYLDKEIQNKKHQLVSVEDNIEMESFGLYVPKFDFTTVDEYKEKLSEVRALQKAMIKDNTACWFSTEWIVNGSKQKGEKMTKDHVKLVLRCFNCECDDAVNSVRFSNYDRMVERIKKAFQQLNKLNEGMQISIKTNYLNLKIDELTLAYEYQRAKQEEKERIRELKEAEREQRALEREIADARKNLEKERKHYSNALDKINSLLEKNPGDVDLLTKKAEIEKDIEDTEKAIADVDYREANQRAGYVYIISNIGSFGENVYKIGMTRRLEPQERIDELGDASVPFRFDVHAMIFSEDAPALEAALHRAFESKKINKVNNRREFFNVTLDEIKEVVKANYSKTTEFIEIPQAEQYRTSLKLAQSRG